jgi:hypothetical protein
MLKLFVLILLGGVVAWFWMNRRDKVVELIDKTLNALPNQGTEEGTKKLVGHSRTASPSQGPLVEVARKLTPLDVPMIQARYEKLGVWQHLNEHQGDVLRRMILEHCQEGREELWWEPLVEFTRFLDYQKGEMPAIIVEATRLQALEVRKLLFAMDYHLRRSGLQLEDIQGESGEEIEPDHTLSDGVFKVVYKVRGRAFRFPATVEGGLLDVLGLVRTINGLCERKKATGRFVMLPPTGTRWCLVYTVFTVAEQVDRARWGQLPMPKALDEADVERVSEELHSVVPPERDPPDEVETQA